MSDALKKSVTIEQVLKALREPLSYCPSCSTEEYPEYRKGRWVHEKPDSEGEGEPDDWYEECDVAPLHDALHNLGLRFPGGPA